MATKNVGGTGGAATAGTSADTVAFTSPGRQLRIRNTHATQSVTVGVVGNTTSAAAALTAATALAGVTSGADGYITIPAGKDAVVFKTGQRDTYCAIQYIASGASTPIWFEWTPWYD